MNTKQQKELEDYIEEQVKILQGHYVTITKRILNKMSDTKRNKEKEYLEGTIPYEEFKANKLDEQIESFTIFENSETNENTHKTVEVKSEWKKDVEFYLNQEVE